MYKFNFKFKFFDADPFKGWLPEFERLKEVRKDLEQVQKIHNNFKNLQIDCVEKELLR